MESDFVSFIPGSIYGSSSIANQEYNEVTRLDIVPYWCEVGGDILFFNYQETNT